MVMAMVMGMGMVSWILRFLFRIVPSCLQRTVPPIQIYQCAQREHIAWVHDTIPQMISKAVGCFLWRILNLSPR